MKKLKIVLPHTQHRLMYNNLEQTLDCLIQLSKLLGMIEDVQHLSKARATLQSIRRLNGRLDASLYIEICSILGMTVCNYIDSKTHIQAGMVVYPTLIAIAFYIACLMDKMNKQKDILKNHMSDWAHNIPSK